jgi:lysyl-tRNA synthetase class 2
MLERRAQLLAQARQFFAERRVLEVDTPLVINAAVTDVHIHSARVELSTPGTATRSADGAYFLHTSPEYAMKRLIAAGSGDIYQICHVVRGFERGRLHNVEFTLIEWYRLGFSLNDLMGEVDALVRALLGAAATGRITEQLTYREAFVRELGIDPHTASVAELAEQSRACGLQSAATAARDELLEFLMATRIGPRLGTGALTFVRGYPASQAALARLDPDDPRAALRFELYCDGIELANGFQELADPAEQRARFASDVQQRQRLGLPSARLDERLLAALEAGLPECAGVALGFDRVLMLASGAATIDDVLTFPTERA